MSAGNSLAGGALPSPILLCSISLKNEMSFDSITIEIRFPFQTDREHRRRSQVSVDFRRAERRMDSRSWRLQHHGGRLQRQAAVESDGESEVVFLIRQNLLVPSILPCVLRKDGKGAILETELFWIEVRAAYDTESLADCLAVLVSFYWILPGPGSLSGSRFPSQAGHRNQGRSGNGVSQRSSRFEFYLSCQPGRAKASQSHGTTRRSWRKTTRRRKT